jgi:aminodeoxyfutalosine synthase
MSNATLESAHSACSLAREAESLDAIREKVSRGQRLSIEDGEALYATPDIWSVCEMADSVRRRLHGDAAYYNINRHLNYSNVCALSCKFCEFYRKNDEPGSYTRDMEYVKGSGPPGGGGRRDRDPLGGGAAPVSPVQLLHRPLLDDPR